MTGTNIEKEALSPPPKQKKQSEHGAGQNATPSTGKATNLRVTEIYVKKDTTLEMTAAKMAADTIYLRFDAKIVQDLARKRCAGTVTARRSPQRCRRKRALWLPLIRPSASRTLPEDASAPANFRHSPTSSGWQAMVKCPTTQRHLTPFSTQQIVIAKVIHTSGIFGDWVGGTPRHNLGSPLAAFHPPLEDGGS